MEVHMRIILLLIGILVGCGAPAQYYQEKEHQEEMRFSDDPILDGYYRAQYLEMLRRCGSGDDECRK